MYATQINEKLVMLSTISLRSGIPLIDFHDIKLWMAKTKEGEDMDALTEKDLERIQAIYPQYFD